MHKAIQSLSLQTLTSSLIELYGQEPEDMSKSELIASLSARRIEEILDYNDL